MWNKVQFFYTSVSFIKPEYPWKVFKIRLKPLIKIKLLGIF